MVNLVNLHSVSKIDPPCSLHLLQLHMCEPVAYSDASIVNYCMVCLSERRFVEITTVFHGLHGARAKFEDELDDRVGRDAAYVCNYR